MGGEQQAAPLRAVAALAGAVARLGDLFGARLKRS
jgi:hypothetical protein